MAKRTIFLDGNLKLLRNRKGISQEVAAKGLGVTRSKLASYENGNVRNPQMADLITIAAFYRISVDTMLKVDLSKLSDLKMKELEQGNDMYIKGTNVRVLATTVDKTNKEHIELVPIKAKAGYVNGYHDPEYIGKLPVFSLPFLNTDRKYRVFPVTGDSMLPFPEDAYMIGEFIEDWNTIKNGSKCLVITKSEGFVLKELQNNLTGSKSFQLKSLNPSYNPYEIKAEEILEIWNFKGYIDLKWPETNMLGINSLLTKVNELKDSLIEIGNK